MLLANLTHVLVIVTALSIPLAVLDGTLFAWHPALMAVGFLGLMTEGVLTSITFRSLDGTERLRKVWIHFAWQVSAVSLVIGGFCAIYQNKVNHGKAHFKSVHGKFGLATFASALFVAVGGALSFRRFGVVSKLPEPLQPKVKWLHRNAGLFVWLLSLVTVELALTHPSVWKGVLSELWQFTTGLLGVVLLSFAWQQRQAAKPKLPVYQDATKQYGVVNAADELNKTV